MSISPDEGCYITKQAFMDMSGSIPSSVQSSENSLNSCTPTGHGSMENVTSANTSKTTTNKNSVSSRAYAKAFELNKKDLSITLSCHSSDSSNGGNQSNKSSNEDVAEETKKNKKDGKNGENQENSKDKNKGTKKYGFKYLKNTISKTFSKASFRKFSSHSKTVGSNSTIEGQQNFNFESKEEEEEFNNFVNNLNTKNSSTKHRPTISKRKEKKNLIIYEYLFIYIYKLL